jgi:glycosyltransferase involved in cell wall biosynthesis
MRILDPSGASSELVEKYFPDSTYHRIPDDNGPYDVGMIHGDLDNKTDPGERINSVCRLIKRPGGRVYVSVPEGRVKGSSTPGRRRAWRSVDVADLLRRFGKLEDLGIDDHGYVSAWFEPMGKGQEIAIWTGYAIGPWHPMDITTRGLGGSETAAWRLAEELAKAGHIVTLYGHFNQEGSVKDVILKSWKNFDPTEYRKCLVAFRNATMFDMPINAETKILWLEDTAGNEGINKERMKSIDYVCGVSEWHKQNILEVYPWIDSRKVIAARNGIVPSYFEGEQPDREKRVVYTSSPDRGLAIALECWPEIKKQVPDATFTHLYGPWYDIVANHNPELSKNREKIKKLSEHDGVEILKGKGQKGLAHLMRSSLVWVLPSYYSPGQVKFDETSCISCMEAQAAGCRVVCGNWGALAENVKTGCKIDGDPSTKEWKDKFIEGVVDGLTNVHTQSLAQQLGPEGMEGMGWEGASEIIEAIYQAAPAIAATQQG